MNTAAQQNVTFQIRSRMGNKMTFDECVQKRLPDCDPKRMWVQIPWFCGYFKKVS